MEDGGKSPFGNAEVKGYVKWIKKTDATGKTKTTYTMMLTDVQKHGFNKELTESDIKRVNISTATTGVAATTVTGGTVCILS